MSEGLATYVEGSGDSAILLLHGGPGVPDYLSEVSGILRRTFRVIRFDQRGTGQSPCESNTYSLDDYVDDVESVRRSCGLDRFALFGHSWGGLLAQLYAARHADRVTKLCLCSSSIGLGQDWIAMERAVMAHNRRRSGLIGFALLGLEQLLAMVPGAVGDRAARRMMARVWRNYFDPPSTAPAPAAEWLAGIHSRAIFATRKAAVEADSSALLGVDSRRVLIVFGESDIYGDTTGRLIARYPKARVAIIPHAGHIPWLQNRAAFADLLDDFFKQQRAA